MNTKSTASPQPVGGFSLLEMLVAIATLAVIVTMLAQILSLASTSTAASQGRLETDDQARLVLDRIERDLASMVDRKDLNYQMLKNAGNDEFYFFGSVEGILPSTVDPVAEPPNGLTLIGYRIRNNRLERLPLAQTFDGMKFLSYATNGTLDTTTGIKASIDAAVDSDYHVLCNGVFRLELGFILKDGTFEVEPWDVKLNPSPSGLGTRRWNPDGLNFAEVCVINDGTRTVYRPLGWQDVASVVITLAIIDSRSSVTLTPSDLDAVAAQFVDATQSSTPTSLTLPAQDWTRTINDASNSAILQRARGSVRIYQRAFHVN